MPLIDNQVLDRNFSSATRPSEISDALRRRVGMLREPDRTLFQLMLAGNVSRRQVARVLGIPAGTVTRRLRRIANRVHDPIVILLTDSRCPLSPDFRQLGIEHFLQGQSVCELSELHEMRPARVRDVLTFIRGWHKGMTLARGAS